MARKLQQLARDPVLRQYLWCRLTGRIAPRPILPAGSLPPYLRVAADVPPPQAPWTGAPPPPTELAPLTLDLPGESVTVASPAEAFSRPYADGESESALHRFAWLPLAGENRLDWAAALWREWLSRFGSHDDGPAWEAYTASERACNLLDWARRGLLVDEPARLAEALAAHVGKILARLEYHGEFATHNHLANNGRGLFRLGVELGLPEAARIGLTILEHEAERLLLPSGLLREGSSHYHLLYVRNYADCWRIARRHHHPETETLAAILARLAAVLPGLCLPGGLPLIGDISPDSPPDFLFGLLPGQPRGGWLATLPTDEAEAVLTALAEAGTVAPHMLATDGLLRCDAQDWSALMWVAPGGWCHYPGHGHHDIGSFELHYLGEKVIVDPGRGGYGESGEAAFYRSAAAHNGLTLGRHDPYPVNKPYYDDAFRRRVAGPPPRFAAESHSARVEFAGYKRFGIDLVARTLTLSPAKVTLHDKVTGQGRHKLVRRFHTPLPVRPVERGVLLGERFLLSAPGARFTIEPRTLWSAYGRGHPGHAVVAATTASLPWDGQINIEVA